jgi:hypothetical protein
MLVAQAAGLLPRSGCWSTSPLGSGFYFFQLGFELSSAGFNLFFHDALLLKDFLPSCFYFNVDHGEVGSYNLRVFLELLGLRVQRHFYYL